MVFADERFLMNVSLVAGMCPHSQWEKVAKGYWTRSMSPFDHKILDIRTVVSHRKVLRFLS
ncbi:hypothetical protein DEO72_LG6g2932 [Vigna unguiculata]|uniref:Uncharacterized protein n=1 Tax=Vigna unguiculata TaxID=3917 RepID=A0A4D6MEK1_VIGUN|nr:hypothetical protein DEO72_LG6g2932 [Vigna unguiculata]